LVPGSSLGSGPYKPTTYGNPPDGFPPISFPSSPFYTMPGTIDNAATIGGDSFASSFAGSSPNGNWDLYFDNHNSSLASAGFGSNGGWCVNITPNVPNFTITETHSPADFFQGGTGQITINVSNTGAAAVTSGGSAYPVTITDPLPGGLSYASISSGTDWNCSGTTTVTCTDADVVAGGGGDSELVLNLNVASNAAGGNNPTVVSEGPSGTFGTPTGLSSPDNIPVVAPPVFSVSEGSSGTFTQGQTGGTLTVTVSNVATSTSLTQGNTTVTETLPTGYALSSYTGTGWTCTGTSAVSCSSSQQVANGASFNVIDIVVSVPSSAPNPTTTSAATASGGGALASATSGTVSFPVVQVPHTMTAGSSTTPQSAAINTAFGTALSVTVLDAGGNPVSGVSVTFTAPASGASGVFASSGTNTATVQTNASGVASAGTFTANLTLGGYNVTAAATNLTTVDFSLTNKVGTATHFSVVAPGAATQGVSFNFTVTALDVGNNTVTGYTGTVHLSSSDVAATLPGNYTFTAGNSGTATFSATLATPGNQTITATDIATSITGTSGSINVPSYTQIANFSISGVGPIYNRASRLYFVTVTITNTGSTTIAAPIELVFNGLPSGITLSNAAGTAPNNSPYMTIASAIAAGASASVTAEFSNPSNVLIPISITAYSGAF
jgi:uncharacterized repeat protein (TIGR01451 family)